MLQELAVEESSFIQYVFLLGLSLPTALSPSIVKHFFFNLICGRCYDFKHLILRHVFRTDSDFLSSRALAREVQPQRFASW